MFPIIRRTLTFVRVRDPSFVNKTCLMNEILLDFFWLVGLRPPLKKSLFPVQLSAIIMASREAAKSFFFFFFFFPCIENGRENAGGKKKNREM